MSFIWKFLLQASPIDTSSTVFGEIKDLENIQASEVTWIFSSWAEKALNFGIKVILAIIAFYVGRFLLRLLIKWIDKIMEKRGLERAARTFLHSFANIGGYLVLVTVIISVLGFEPVSLAALLASLGVAIGMGLSGQLQNLAGGLIILLTHPFRVGDFISTNSHEGIVESVELFHTIIITFENKCIYVPNGLLSSNVITNYSRKPLRRNEWIIGVEYDQDFDKVKALLQGLIAEEPRIAQTPEPTIVLQELADSSVNVMVRAWSTNSELWNVYWDMNERIYKEFNKAGIGFPFPHLTLHGDINNATAKDA